MTQKETHLTHETLARTYRSWSESSKALRFGQKVFNESDISTDTIHGVNIFYELDAQKVYHVLTEYLYEIQR